MDNWTSHEKKQNQMLWKRSFLTQLFYDCLLRIRGRACFSHDLNADHCPDFNDNINKYFSDYDDFGVGDSLSLIDNGDVSLLTNSRIMRMLSCW